MDPLLPAFRRLTLPELLGSAGLFLLLLDLVLDTAREVWGGAVAGRGESQEIPSRAGAGP